MPDEFSPEMRAIQEKREALAELEAIRQRSKEEPP